MDKKNQRPSFKGQPKGQRSPAIAARPRGNMSPVLGEDPTQVLSQIISWRFSKMDKKGKGKCSLKLLHDYEEFILKYEKLSRQEIETKAHCHPCSPNKLTKVGKQRIKATNLDVETLYQIDFKTPCRLWGVWEDSVFHIIWLDQKHAFYN